jgi:hypothetical protein
VSVGSCGAVGFYTDGSSNIQGLLLGTTASPGVVLSAPASGTAGSAIAPGALSAVLSGGFSPTGSIGFSVFGPQASPPASCASGTTVGAATVSGNAAYVPGAGFTPPSAGDYWWYATYGGDARDDPAASRCGAGMTETVVAAAPAAGPNNAFVTRSVKVDHRTGAITFTETVSDPGTFRFVLTFRNGSFGVIAAKAKKCRPGQVRLKGRCRALDLSFGSGTKTVTAAGTVSFTVKPSRLATRALEHALAHHKGLTVTARLRYQSILGGSPVTHTRTILDKLTKTKKRH